MKGILLISHGRMAEGMFDSAHLFFGDDIAQMDYLCLMEGDDPEAFGGLIEEKAKELDTGDGVVILAELFGGTPSNQAIPLLRDGWDLIPGANFPILMQLLADREYGEVDIPTLIQAGKDGIVDISEELAGTPSSDADESSDDWF